MGFGYWILVWDAWGEAVNMVNPRLHHEGKRNWWSCSEDFTDEQVIQKHDLTGKYGEYFKIIR